jgi:hypothetical protein
MITHDEKTLSFFDFEVNPLVEQGQDLLTLAIYEVAVKYCKRGLITLLEGEGTPHQDT